MPRPRNDILQGTLVLLILKSLAAQGRMHGYAITSHIHMVSAELLRVEEGSLYPALHRMELAGLLSSEWRTSETNRQAKYYKLTAAGRKRLSAQSTQWKRLVSGIARVMEG